LILLFRESEGDIPTRGSGSSRAGGIAGEQGGLLQHIELIHLVPELGLENFSYL